MDTSHAWPAQEVQEPLPAACCRAEVERSCFLPQTPLEAQALPAELLVLAEAGTARGDLAKAAIPGCGSAGGRDGIKEGRRQHLLAPLVVTPPGWREARPRHPAMLPSAGLEPAGNEGVMLVVIPFQLGTVTVPEPRSFGACEEHPEGREGVAGGRRGASLPRRFFQD